VSTTPRDEPGGGRPDGVTGDDRPEMQDPDDDEVDEASEESFPASDPPARW
jgi:hypothetical protein